ncbi:MAG TPA: hypothetical protein VKG21_11960 [Casimicrobiaceae bacterium]|nr:hypothetical protein [Casimicrobiaceae bacterium]
MRTVLVGFVSLLSVGPAYADAIRDALSEMMKCVEINEPAERLKCFDSAVPTAKNALAVPEKAPEKSLLDWFGLNRPPKPVTKTEDFGKPQPEPGPGEEITEIKATVIQFARAKRNRALFVLDNGQVWKQLDGDTADVRDPPSDEPIKVTIETGVLGSYNLMIDGRNGIIKVSRVK